MTKPLTPQEVNAILDCPKLLGMDVVLDERVERGTVEFRDQDGKLLGKIVDIDCGDANEECQQGRAPGYARVMAMSN